MNTPPPIRDTLASLDWPRIAGELDESGVARLPSLLDPAACARLVAMYDDPDRFRSRVVMARHGFGSGEYQYLAYPLPDTVQGLRQSLYPHLAPIANAWAARLAMQTRYPATLDDMLARCHEAGQSRPTPLLLRYHDGDYNCLHQDLYGEHLFPIQLTVLLNQPGEDFDGGEFVITEQRPRMQSRVEVVALERGDGVLFAVNERPRQGKRGEYRVKMRHGVSRIRRGERHALGVIFHDAT